MSATSLCLRLPRLGRGLAALLGVLWVAGCGHTPPPVKEKKVEVVVTTPISDEVLDYQDFTGRMDAFRTIDIRARVTGYVDAAPFKEGDRVRKGDVLFQIDPRTYQAKVDQAAADLETKKAMTVKAEERSTGVRSAWSQPRPPPRKTSITSAATGRWPGPPSPWRKRKPARPS